MSNLSTYKYRNVTVSGLPGCGSTTLLQGLKDELQFDGWKGYSGGEFMRAYAKEKGLFNEKSGHHHSATDYEDDFDRKIDLGVREKLKVEKKWILEAWLSGFMAQGVDGVLKVLVVCSDDAVRVDRIVNRDGVHVDAAKENLINRYQANYDKWSNMYSKEWEEWVVQSDTMTAKDPIDFWHPDLYDLVIDTYKLNKEETLESVLDAIKKT
jgi:cytidylate kinase